MNKNIEMVAAAATTIDPALTIIASAFGGAVLTAIVTLATFALTARRDHVKWLNDLKYKTYLVKIVTLEKLERLTAYETNDDGVRAEAHGLMEAVSAADMTLIASAKVSESHSLVHESLAQLLKAKREGMSSDRQAFIQDMENLINAMRQDLKVPARRSKRKSAKQAAQSRVE